MTLSPAEWVMVVLVLAAATMVITVGVLLHPAAAFFLSIVALFVLCCLGAVVGVGGGR